MQKASDLKIYVVGNSRSGTTMMARILGNHPDIYAFHEVHFFEHLWATREKDKSLSTYDALSLAALLIGKHREGYFSRINPYEYMGAAKEIVSSIKDDTLTAVKVYAAFHRYETLLKGKRIPCEQTPQNVFYIGEILELFPEARVINMIRDPRDVLLSQKWKWKRHFLGAKNIPLLEAFRCWTNYHPITINKLWNAAVTAGERYDKDTRVFSLRFEDLLQNPAEELRKICKFVGVSYDNNLLLVPQVGSSSETDKTVKKGINKSKTGNWQKGGLTSTEISISQRITGIFMQKYNYEIIQTGSHSFRELYYILSFPVKTAFALFLNLKRMKNLREAVMLRLRGRSPAKPQI